ncbi:hypothetical protein [Stappia sp. ES.058]|uniref:capsular polysaccharide export protein, LipB/KpsS family n=1 Tax=Stappia sp. ES.058 TaxID=1881061 RepID=UPI00087D59B2|nr:hypothetical protein [Stappia sp. ES.058]SDT97389.1 capsular polysaccharide export protein [Stappia sp. ES.058]
MSKLTMLLRKPKAFFRDAKAILKQNAAWSAAVERAGRDAPTAVLFGFARWKTFILDYLEDYNVAVASFGSAATEAQLLDIGRHASPHVFTWSYKSSPDLPLFCKRHGIPLTYVEDGFIRSFGLGADRTSPASLVFDQRAMHFDRLRVSQLEQILSSYDFQGDDALMGHAARLAKRMKENGLSKYSFLSKRSVNEVLAPGKEHVLVLGQVEDDLSIRFGAERVVSGNELVMLAAEENPHAQILYRPHPESLAFSKPHYSNPRLVDDVCTILGSEFAIGDCLESADVVYTVTSLAGFEAALRGKPVVTLGAPFYAGWGFTENRLATPTRTRRLGALEVLAGAYLKYPRYNGIHPEQTGKEEAILRKVEELLPPEAL